MSIVRNLLNAPPSLHDIGYVIRALATRPGEIPGIVRRYFARRRAEVAEADPIGVRVLLQSWDSALAAGVFEGRPGAGGDLIIHAPLDNLPDAISALQFASAVDFIDVEDAPAFPALSLEAARHGLRQRSSAPERATAARAAFVAVVEVGPDLRAALEALAAEEIGAL